MQTDVNRIKRFTMTPNDLQRDFEKVAIQAKYNKIAAHAMIEQIMQCHVETLQDFVFARWREFAKTVDWVEK